MLDDESIYKTGDYSQIIKNLIDIIEETKILNFNVNKKNLI